MFLLYVVWLYIKATSSITIGGFDIPEEINIHRTVNK